MAEPVLDFDPAFGSRMDKLRASMDAAGIKGHFLSGKRTYEDQRQLYANMLAGRAGKKLPYPDRGPVHVAAVPGTSPHEKGVAADYLADDSRQQARADALAQQLGLATVAGDPGHYQLASGIAYGTQPNTTSYAPQTSQAPAVAAINAAVPIKGALAARETGSPFLDALAQIESSNQNVYSKVDKDVAGPNSRSQGYFQINTPTWQDFAAKAGVDLKQYPNAMSAPREIQQQVAQVIPFSRFGGRTRDMLAKQFGPLDTKATIGGLAANFGTGPMDPSAQARGSTVNPPIGGTQTAEAPAVPPPTPPSLLGALTLPGKDAQGKETPSFAQQMLKAYIDNPKQARAAMEAQAPEEKMPAGPPSRNTSSMGGALLPSVPQSYGQTLDSLMMPLTWNDQAQQMPTMMQQSGFKPTSSQMNPGFSLNSILPQGRGMGYGVDPSQAMGYGFG